MNKTVLILITLVLLLALGVFYNNPEEQKSVQVHTKAEKHVPSIKEHNSEKTITTMHTKKIIQPNVEQETASTEKYPDSFTPVSLYEILPIEEAQLITPPRKHIAPIGAIRIKQTMAELKPNDTLTLSDIEGSDYRLTIQSIYKNSDGSTSTTANYKDEGILYTTTITQSEKSSYITLSTANGLYEIETNGDTGYIYRTDTIRKQLQSRTPNDVIILPIPKEK